MRSRLFLPLPLLAFALGETARCAFPTPEPTPDQAETSGNGQQGGSTPGATPSDWAPPYELLPGQYQDLENNARTDGTSPLPTFEMRSTETPPADSTEIDPATGALIWAATGAMPLANPTGSEMTGPLTSKQLHAMLNLNRLRYDQPDHEDADESRR